MDYIKSGIDLKELVKHANAIVLQKNSTQLELKNLLLLKSNFGQEIEIEMESFTDKCVNENLNAYANSEAFVMTDLVSTVQDGVEMTYFLLKAYHSIIEKGVVYYQLIDKTTLQPKGELSFSNLEDNIFYQVPTQEGEESSCNAIETDENTVKEPSIAFLIGHMNEDRLLYDIQRLILETANNVQKHKGRFFKFTLQVTVFGKKPSEEFKQKLQIIHQKVDQDIKHHFENSSFIFALEE